MGPALWSFPLPWRLGHSTGCRMKQALPIALGTLALLCITVGMFIATLRLGRRG